MCRDVLRTAILFALAVSSAAATTAPSASGPVDRQAVVARHAIVWPAAAGQIPIGNGGFCFNADGTGLQTFGGSTMADWAWHSFPLPEGWTADRVPPTGTFQQGRNTGPDVFPKDAAAIRTWMFDNPHKANLARFRLGRADGSTPAPTNLTDLARTMDLWTGLHAASYRLDGQPVRVETCVHPELDLVAVRIESPLLARGGLGVTVDFPWPAIGTKTPWVGDFDASGAAVAAPAPRPDRRADLRRTYDGLTYGVALGWSAGADLREAGGRALRLAAGDDTQALEFVCAFGADGEPAALPSFAETKRASAERMAAFWRSGGAIDLSGSRDPRWRELERRIVLSQYLLAAQSAGRWPSAEVGLMGLDPWRGQFHMEMVWWHLAHYALWDRWPMADRAFGCYRTFTPAARALAEQLGYRGLKWPKSVGPEGRSAPWQGNQVLLWKQPHPIFFAELEYRLKPGRATLEKWADIVQGTAEHMADYAVRDAQTGVYSLAPAMPPSEQGITRDTVFDLAYWRWGLDAAQRWRERMGLPREPKWDEVRRALAPLPEKDGVYVHSPEWRDETYARRAYEHPDPLGVFGMLPPIEGVDRTTAHRTLAKVVGAWNWDRCWGWDFPWTAMAAARLGEPATAVDMLLRESSRNRYDERGVCTGGPCPYLPGNGGLLYAVAMMAAGWDGAPAGPAPGFPTDGSWTVRWEGLKPAP